MIDQVIRDRQLSSKHVFIDIGAHVGEELEKLIRHKVEVYSFEPNPVLMKDLKENYKSFPNVHLIEAAAWYKDGSVPMYMSNHGLQPTLGSTLIKSKVNISQDYSINVPCINIGQWLLSLDKDIEVIKIDAEGAEFQIIDSIVTQFPFQRIKYWYMEDHEHKINSNDKGWRHTKERVGKLCKELGITLLPWED